MDMKKMTIRLEPDQIEFIQSLKTNDLTSSHVIRGMIDYLMDLKKSREV